MIEILADDKNLVTFRPRLKVAFGSITTAILFQQIVYWWVKSGHNPFYKFIEPCGHDAYNDGDSWSEELMFTKREFRSAFKRLVDLELVKSVIDHTRLTNYYLNEENASNFLDVIYGNQYNTEIAKLQFATLQIVTYLSNKSSLTYVTKGHLYTINTETSTETTTDIEEKIEIVPFGPSKPDEEKRKKLAPKKESSKLGFRQGQKWDMFWHSIFEEHEKEAILYWLEYLNELAQPFRTQHQAQAVKDDFEKHGVDAIFAAMKYSAKKGYKSYNLSWAKKAEQEEQAEKETELSKLPKSTQASISAIELWKRNKAINQNQ